MKGKESYRKASQVAMDLDYGLALLQRARNEKNMLIPTGPWLHALTRLLRCTHGAAHLQVSDLCQNQWLWLLRLYRFYAKRIIHVYPVWRYRSALSLATAAFLQFDDPIPFEKFTKTSLTNHALLSDLASVSFDPPEFIGRFVTFLSIARDFLKFLEEEVEGGESGEA